MPCTFTRREILASTLGAGALVFRRGGGAAWAAGPSALPRNLPDHSQDAPSLPVAIQRCESYETKLLEEKLGAALELVGGIKKLVQGKTVTIKINCTGGPTGTIGGLPHYRTYLVHPRMVAAVCAAAHRAGARRIVIVESQYSPKSPEEVYGLAGWDIAAIKSAGGHSVTMVDTRNRGRWPKYSRLVVPWGGYLYPAFDVNQCYEKTDVLISLAKLKDHGTAGITLSAKNLFGMPPTSLYGKTAPDENCLSARMEILHRRSRTVPAGVPAEVDPNPPLDPVVRVPRITADLVGARPIDLAVIDGIESNRGGEGPWIKGVEPVQPKLLAVGRNPICTDAVCAAVMGYDPAAEHFQFPFQGENHLKLLAAAGVGTIDLKRIEVRGLSIQEALFPFNPRRLPVHAAATYGHGQAFA